MDLHKDKERLRHQNQVRLLNQVMTIIPKCHHDSQTRVKKLRHLVLYYHFIKMIHAHISKDHFKVENDFKSIIPNKRAKPIFELSEMHFEPKPKRQRANIVFLQVDRSTNQIPNIHEKAVLNDNDYETFYNLEESPLTINLGHNVPEEAAVNNACVNQAVFISNSSNSPVSVSNLVSHENEASIVSDLVNQNEKFCFGLEPIIYSEENVSSDKENFSSEKEKYSPVIENYMDASFDDQRVEEFSVCGVEQMPETVLANNKNSLFNKYENIIPSISNTHSNNFISKSFPEQSCNTLKSSCILKERNSNVFETYPGQKALEEYVSGISSGSCKNNIDKSLYIHKSSASSIEKSADISETYLFQNPAEYVSNILSGSFQNKIDETNFEISNSSFDMPQLYNLPSYSKSNSDSNSNSLSTDILNIIEPISETSNHSYTDFVDNAVDHSIAFSNDRSAFNRSHPTRDVNCLSVPNFADTSLTCYDEIRSGCFLPVCYNYGCIGNDSLQSDVTFGIPGNESLPYYGNVYPVSVLENPAIIHPIHRLGFCNPYSDTIAKSNYNNGDVSLYSACSDPMMVENINTEKFPFQPKQEMENSNCYPSAMPETRKSTLQNEDIFHSLLQYVNKY